MKKYFLILFTLAIFMYACRKNYTDQPDGLSKESTADFTIQQAKSYLDSSLSTSSTTIKLQSVESNKNPDPSGFVFWKRARELRTSQFNVVEVPLIVTGLDVSLFNFPQDSVKITPDVTVARSILTRVIIYQDANTKKVNKEIITYQPDKAYLNRHHNDASKNWLDKLDPDFSGYIEYKRWDGTPRYVLRIVNGKRVARYTLTVMPANTSPQQIQSLKTAGTVCYADCFPVYNENCFYDSEGQQNCQTVYSGYDDCYYYCYDDGQNPPSDPDPQPDPPGDPPPGGGGPTCTSIINGKVILGDCTPPTPPDPCDQISQVKQILQNSVIAQQWAAITAGITQPSEYATPVVVADYTAGNLTYLSKSIGIGPIDGNDIPFTWNSTDGYSFGELHDHNNGTPPSPQDIFRLMQNLNNSQLTQAGANAITFYKNHAFIGVATDQGNFVVTVSNWDALQTIYNTYMADKQAWLTNFNNIMEQTNQTNALSTIFGNNINMFYADPNSLDFQKLTVNQDKLPTITPCSTN